MKNAKNNPIASLNWKDGKPFCPYCKLLIEPCHKCQVKTALEYPDYPDVPCADCEKREDIFCRVCRDCLRKNNG